MTKETKERLSALVDGELSTASTAEVISRMKASPDLCGAWDRYHLIGDAIRGEGLRGSADGIADNVRELVLAEPAIIARPIPINRPKSNKRILRPLAGAAIAASVAAVAVVTLPRLNWDSPTAGPAQVVSKSITPGSYQTGTRWKNLAEPALESKLNRYLENHSEYASSGGMGVVPYSSFVSYDSTRNRP